MNGNYLSSLEQIFNELRPESVYSRKVKITNESIVINGNEIDLKSKRRIFFPMTLFTEKRIFSESMTNVG